MHFSSEESGELLVGRREWFEPTGQRDTERGREQGGKVERTRGKRERARR